MYVVLMKEVPMSLLDHSGEVVLYKNNEHQCIAFSNLVEGYGIQAN